MARRSRHCFGRVNPIRAKSVRIMFALALFVGLGVLWSLGPKPHPGRVNWLQVSAPTFSCRTNADGVFATASFTVSNAAPYPLDYAVIWYEFRNRTDRRVLATSVKSGNAYIYGQFGHGKMVSLDPRATVTEMIKSDQSGDLIVDPMFCAEIGWMEHSARRRIGVALDDGIEYVLQIFDLSWEPRFWKEDTVGSAFGSNLDLEGYFRTVYGVVQSNGQLSEASGTNYVAIAADFAFRSFSHWSTNKHVQPMPR